MGGERKFKLNESKIYKWRIRRWRSTDKEFLIFKKKR